MSVAVESHAPEPGRTDSTGQQQRLIAGRFRLLSPLGRGGMGRVYRAHDETLDRAVAVKLIYDDAIHDRDLRHACALEARAAARLNHPGIVRILDSGFDDGHLYVVMSLAEGRTLAEILREHGPLPVDRALDVAAQVADALAAAHAEGVIHCDVKPGNLLVDDDGHIRLVDFGIARVTSSTTGLTGELLQGSAQYVAPEQVEGASVDARTDLYALGSVLYEMLVGKTPFGGGAIASILARRLVNDPPPLRQARPGIPPAVEQVTLKALAREPGRRYQTAAELRDALLTIRHDTAQCPALTRRPGRLGSWFGPAPRMAAALAATATTRARLLTPARRPTLRTGVGLAVIFGLLFGVAAAKCGVDGVSAEAKLAGQPVTRSVQSTQPHLLAPTASAPATPTAVPLAAVVVPTATAPPPPTITTPPTAVPEPPAAAVSAPPPVPAAPPVVQAPPPVRALTLPPPAPAPPKAEAPAPPPPSDKPQPKPKPKDDDGDRPNLSNTPRGNDKTPEERQKLEAKQREPEKRAEPPKPEPKKPEPKSSGNKKKR